MLLTPTNSRHCHYCGKQSLVFWQRPALAVHSLLVVVTCGLWLPIWFAVVLFGGGWACHECGGRT